MNAAALRDDLEPLRRYVRAMTALVGATTDEARLLGEGRELLAALLAGDDWLPAAFATPSAERYVQYLLHCDPLERFSVVSFVWQPGQATPVHDHTVWGLVGQLRGAERCEEYAADGERVVATGRTHVMERGAIDAVSPTIGDWHRVSNATRDRTAISIHVYGANIGAVRRHRLDAQGAIRDFVSGYDSPVTPNLWDRAAAVRAGTC
ncbi:MAG: cysteine dioxygenase [Gammaproteobacteria bacterium]